MVIICFFIVVVKSKYEIFRNNRLLSYRKCGNRACKVHDSNETRMSYLVKTIKEIRKNAGLTQKQLSELTGIPKRTIENWEIGSRTPPDWVLVLLEYYVNGHVEG